MNKIMKKYLFTAAAMMVAMTSCVKEADVVVPQDDDKVWVEFAAGVQTKVALDDNAVTWEDDDKVSINGVEFAVKNESISDDKTTATFGAYVEPSFLDAENFTAVYPVDAVSWEGEYAPKVTIPTVQDGAANIVAMATVDDLESALAFRHVASFIKFQVPAEVNVVKLEVPEDSDDLLAGSFHDISFGVDGNDKVTSITYSEVPYAATSITLTLPEDAKFLPATDYYAAVIPGVKENLTLSFDDKVYKTWESVNIKQGMIAKVSAKKERNLAYKLADEVVTEVAYTMGTEFTAPVLTGEMTGVVYASSNAEVATVSETGKVTILAVGTTTITASAEENNTHLAGSASYTLTVNKAARTLSFSPTSVTATLGKAFTSPVLSGVKDGETVVYSSSKPSVATIDNNGAVTLVDAGETTITAIVAEDEKYLEGKATYTLTVEYAKSAWSVQIGGTKTPTYVIGNYYVAKGVSLTASSSFIFINSSNVKIRGIAEKSPVNKWCYLYKSSGDPNMTGVVTAGSYDLYIDPTNSAYVLVPAGQSMPAFSYANQALYFLYEKSDWTGLYGWTPDPKDEFFGGWNECGSNSKGTFKTNDDKTCSYWLMPDKYYGKKVYVIVRNDAYSCQTHDTELTITGDIGGYESAWDGKGKVGIYDFDDNKGYSF